MQVCSESSQCAFFLAYADQAAFRKEHFNYFCFGPLAEDCARRIFHQKKGLPPRTDYSPTGLIFNP
jgi:hypothetical protein